MIRGEQVGQLTLSRTHFVVVVTRGNVCSSRLIDTFIHMQIFNASFASNKLNYVFARYSYIPEVQCGLRTLEDINLGFFHKAWLWAELLHHCTHTEQMMNA